MKMFALKLLSCILINYANITQKNKQAVYFRIQQNEKLHNQCFIVLSFCLLCDNTVLAQFMDGKLQMLLMIFLYNIVHFALSKLTFEM